MLFLLVALLVTGCSNEVDIEPPKPTSSDAEGRAAQAQVTLDSLAQALSGGSAEHAADVAAPGAEDDLAVVHRNARALRLDELTMRYVADSAPPSAAERAEHGEDIWAGSVDLTYRYRGFDTQPARLETRVLFAPADDETRIAGFGGGETREPLWLTEQLSVERTPQTLVAVAGRPGRYPDLVSRAARQVSEVLKDWRGSLVVEVPASREGLDAALRAQPGEYDNIAAVTTTADGSLTPEAPVRILVNPDVFGRLKARGAQVVMTHEAVHDAAEAPFTAMPTWLLEGFADHVALSTTRVPVSLAAGQVLREVRKDGLPDRLPTSADLDPTAPGLGATYEEAWLACRYLAREYGEQRLIDFYRAVDQGASTSEAFRSVVGVTQKEFVAGWRDDLAQLAGVAG